MNIFFQNSFPIRLRPALAFDYVLAYTNDVERARRLIAEHEARRSF